MTTQAIARTTTPITQRNRQALVLALLEAERKSAAEMEAELLEVFEALGRDAESAIRKALRA